jgi:hypothetical protein
MGGVHPSLNNVATAVVVVGVVRIVVSGGVPVAIRPVAVVVVPVVVAMKSSSDGAGAEPVEAAILESSSDRARAKTVEASSEGAAVKIAATKAATVEAAATKAAAPVSTATAATASTASTAAACLCTRRKQRPSKQGGCQDHHRSSSSHDFSFRRAEPSVIIELLCRAA